MAFFGKLFSSAKEQVSADEAEKEKSVDTSTHSGLWMVKCTCGFEQPATALGDIRWNASDNPKRLMLCTHCGERTWHSIYIKEEKGPA
ncbi:hypothetical protein L0152_20025 [bacterium]|nr:hypothetical protein [bacterium]